MCDATYDITYSDLNPTLLFAGKNYAHETKPPHCHDHTEIICVLSGKEQYYLDGEIFNVTTGDIIIINPGVMHSSIVPDPEDPALLFFLPALPIFISGVWSPITSVSRTVL